MRFISVKKFKIIQIVFDTGDYIKIAVRPEYRRLPTKFEGKLKHILVKNFQIISSLMRRVNMPKLQSDKILKAAATFKDVNKVGNAGRLKMSSTNLDGDLTISTVKKGAREWRQIKPHLNYRSGPLCSMPTRIDPKNWTPVTSEELKAHQERQMIRGRLRREFWMKAYHPENYKYFTAHSDKSLVRYGWLKTVWHIKDSVRASGSDPLKALLGFAVFTAAYFTYGLVVVGPDDRSILDRIK